jgi:RNA polymerase sigma-70 factor, ECF subfamily
MNIVSEEPSSQPCASQGQINPTFLYPTLTDEALVAAAKLGNHAAFGELWKRYSNPVLGMAFRITGNRDDAEDAIQDTWMKAFTHLNTFHGRAKFPTWLTRIAINSALMILRKKRSHLEDPMDWSFDSETWQQWEVKDKRANIEEHYARKEGLRQAIDRLTPALRTVIEIHQSQDASVEEIANLAGISVAAAKSRLLRARSALRRSLQSSARTPALQSGQNMNLKAYD